MTWVDLGDVAVVPLVQIPRLLIEPAEFFPQLGADRSAWCFQPPWYDGERLVYVIQAFLVVTRDAVVLVDACVGAGKHRARSEFDRCDGAWLDRFRETGLRPVDVSVVVFSHLHVDHVGWAVRDGEPVFPRARHVVTEPEYRYWTSPAGTEAMRRTGDYLTDTVEPLRARGLLDFVAPNAVLAPEIELVPAPGHTPGNVCVRLTGSRAGLVISGDVLHHPVQLIHPGWSTRYCVDPDRSTRTRRALLVELAATGTPMLPAHFAAPSVGRIARAGAGYTFAPAQELLRTGPLSRPATDGRSGARR